jgi:hypothetical protein
MSLRPCTELIRAREAVKNQLDEAVRCKRIAGYDVACYKHGRIVIYYNELLDENGAAAKHVAEQIAEAIYD